MTVSQVLSIVLLGVIGFLSIMAAVVTPDPPTQMWRVTVTVLLLTIAVVHLAK